MKIRLGIFVAALILMPASGLWLTGTEWDDLYRHSTGQVANIPAVLLTTLLFVGYILLINQMVKILTGNSPIYMQRDFFQWMSAGSLILTWLFVYMNRYVANWSMSSENIVMQLLLYSPLFAMLAPAVLITRNLLGTSGGLIKALSKMPSLPAVSGESAFFILAPIASVGLVGSAVWPGQLFWLQWISPLLLLAALQLLWNESTIFSALTSGNWGRMVCAALAGIIVGNFVIFAFQYNGGDVNLLVSPAFLAQLGFIFYGLTCLQLSDLIAENWRGKQRHELFPKKKFPIPIIVKTSPPKKN
ncbi:MAG: hypothetical protein R8M11_01320 [Gallionella sp.]